MEEKKDAARIFNDIVEIIRAVRSNKKIEIFRGGMEKLNFAQIVALYFLFDNPEGMTMGELALCARVKMPTMTDTMSPLVKAGYALRKHNAGDRRKVMITITARGRKLVDFNRNIGIDYLDKYLSKLNHVERNIAMMVVRRTKEILGGRFEK